MPAMSKVVLLLAISAALTLSNSHVFAKTVGPGEVKTSGTSAAPSGAGSKYVCCHHPHPGGNFYRPPGHTQPPCRGPHRGPNGLMIQCD